MNEDQKPYELKVTDRRPDFDKSETLPTQASPNAVIMTAMQKGYDVSLIEKMMALQERYESNEARKAYHEAKAAFNENPPEILKDKENTQFSRGDKKAMYVSLGNILKTVNPALGKHGLSVSFEINQSDKNVTVSCKLSHRMGHSEVVTMTAPPDTSGGNAKNPIQQIKSTITYLRAATFECVTGLAATDEANLDDDGNGSGATDEYINTDQQTEINDLLKETKADVQKFLKYIKAESVETIIAKNYQKAIKALETKREKSS
uniref:Putative Erf family protein n=1 Tax=viral metagenome TaxID=1070528 RepID=A0A6H1ZG05_9ZZZZ